MKDNNFNKLTKVLLYTLCGSIAAFYLYVIYLGFQPRVSDQYRAYYIEHTIPQWTG
ncbi:MAG: hypothetical protein HFJ08_05490 [Lachnospiraceae bacterium]|nr:hypothetical protein [Lachnospiraceae bacterium]MCX4376898.1 hypothetical protein [Lachnospiraceae bacterium]